jgi:hypothetical protein
MGNVYAADVGAHRVRDTCGCVERWRLLRNREGKPRWPIDCARPGEARTTSRAGFRLRSRTPDLESGSQKSNGTIGTSVCRYLPKETTLRAITLACNYGRACGYLTVDGRDVGNVLVAEKLAHTYPVDAIRARGTQAGRS